MSRVFIAGLPESGKSSFLAALAHVVNSCSQDTSLKRNNRPDVDNSYIDQLERQYLSFKKQGRTLLASEANKVAFSLIGDVCPNGLELSLLDASGEAFEEVWTKRMLPQELVESLEATQGILLFLSADEQYQHTLLTDANAALSIMSPEAIAGDAESDEEKKTEKVKWDPLYAAKQTMLVDILQCILSVSADGPKRLNVVVSAWDKLCDENTSPCPAVWFETNLPLLNQFLQFQQRVSFEVFGVSAQGGDYDCPEEKERLMSMDQSCERAYVCPDSKQRHHDLTTVISSLFER